MEIDGIDGGNGHIYRLEKIDEMYETLTTDIHKRDKLSTKYNKGGNIIRVIDNC